MQASLVRNEEPLAEATLQVTFEADSDTANVGKCS